MKFDVADPRRKLLGELILISVRSVTLHETKIECYESLRN
jgi:hypothetical protein